MLYIGVLSVDVCGVCVSLCVCGGHSVCGVCVCVWCVEFVHMATFRSLFRSAYGRLVLSHLLGLKTQKRPPDLWISLLYSGRPQRCTGHNWPSRKRGGEGGF